MDDLLNFSGTGSDRYSLNDVEGQRLAFQISKDKKKDKRTIYSYDKKYTCCTECNEGTKKKCSCCGSKCGYEKYHKGKATKMKTIKAEPNTSFMIAPTNLNNQVSNIYITGRQGLGKSVFVSRYIENFKKVNKDIPVYLISEAREDKLLDPLINKRLSPSQIKTDDIKPEDFEDIAKDFGGCVIIFDDIDSLTDKKPEFLKKNTYALMNALINLSRKHGIHVIYTAHGVLDGCYSKTMINSCSNWVFFSAGINKQVISCLMNKFGLSKEQIKRIIALKDDTKWISICNTIPMTVITENEIMIL